MAYPLPLLSAEVIHVLDERGAQAHVFKGILKNGTMVCLRHELRPRSWINQFKIAEILRGAKNIVNILGEATVCHKECNYKCLVMDLYDQDLWDHLYTMDWSIEPLNLDESLRILIQCAEGVFSMHKRGLIHLDIRTTNFLVDNDLTKIHLTDFGHTIPDGYVTGDTFLGGTGAYIAPEIFDLDSRVITPAADVYSFGVMICEVIFGSKDDDLFTDIVEGNGYNKGDEPKPVQTDYEVFDPFMEMMKVRKLKMTTTLKRLHQLCLRCWYNVPTYRPNMYQVKNELANIRFKHYRDYCF